MKRQQDAVRFGATTIRYTLVRSNQRGTVAVSVHPDGQVVVVAPQRIRRTHIANAVGKKATWVLRQQEFFRQHVNGYPKAFVSGESFHYLGRQYKLKVRRQPDGSTTPVVQLVRGQLLVAVGANLDDDDPSTTVHQAISTWYQQHAAQHVCVIADRFGRRLGLTYRSIRICDMAKRWGSGGHQGRLAFNWRIVMAPRRLVEYVVAHELCHLKHGDHSADFWRLLERVMPDYERRRLELAISGPKFDLA